MDLSPRQRAFFLITLLCRPQDADALFRQLPEHEAERLQALSAELRASRPEDVRRVAKTELRKLQAAPVPNYLSEVHPDWLVDLLRRESPFLIATVLRYLPAERVSAILDALPEDILKALPKLNDTFAVPQELVDSLKRRFEGQFALQRLSEKSASPSFDLVFRLRAHQTAALFLEAGYREIALGLITVPPEARLRVLNRLPPSDRGRVEFYLQTAPRVDEPRVKRAQVHLISKQLDPRDPGLFVKELGWLLFVKALLKEDAPALKIVSHKMSHADAKALLALAEEYVAKNTEAGARAYREDILEAVAQAKH